MVVVLLTMHDDCFSFNNITFYLIIIVLGIFNKYYNLFNYYFSGHWVRVIQVH